MIVCSEFFVKLKPLEGIANLWGTKPKRNYGPTDYNIFKGTPVLLDSLPGIH